jgi:hypothetical protein
MLAELLHREFPQNRVIVDHQHPDGTSEHQAESADERLSDMVRVLTPAG